MSFDQRLIIDETKLNLESVTTELSSLKWYSANIITMKTVQVPVTAVVTIASHVISEAPITQNIAATHNNGRFQYALNTTVPALPVFSATAVEFCSEVKVKVSIK
ncbi:hypothetical protein BPOR_1263g00030 [Botrytis porri]|uniref:Uncharacterized protein n=1 Tax=Botrytis porri TaxID=87229 RepID=A0A4Z1K517_9HELO|nr:hypothetical protein BPOR_1263g00030 [Botrytis porri]